MPCRTEDEYDGEPDSDGDMFDLRELIEEFGIGAILECLATCGDLDPLRMPQSFRIALQPYVDACHEQARLEATHGVDDAAAAACDALKIVEEFGLSDEVSRKTLRWWGDHKQYDAKRKALIMKKVSDIRTKRRIHLAKKKD